MNNLVSCPAPLLAPPPPAMAAATPGAAPGDAKSSANAVTLPGEFAAQLLSLLAFAGEEAGKGLDNRGDAGMGARAAPLQEPPGASGAQPSGLSPYPPPHSAAQAVATPPEAPVATPQAVTGGQTGSAQALPFAAAPTEELSAPPYFLSGLLRPASAKGALPASAGSSARPYAEPEAVERLVPLAVPAPHPALQPVQGTGVAVHAAASAETAARTSVAPAVAVEPAVIAAPFCVGPQGYELRLTPVPAGDAPVKTADCMPALAAPRAFQFDLVKAPSDIDSPGAEAQRLLQGTLRLPGAPPGEQPAAASGASPAAATQHPRPAGEAMLRAAPFAGSARPVEAPAAMPTPLSPPPMQAGPLAPADRAAQFAETTGERPLSVSLPSAEPSAARSPLQPPETGNAVRTGSEPPASGAGAPQVPRELEQLPGKRMGRESQAFMWELSPQLRQFAAPPRTAPLDSLPQIIAQQAHKLEPGFGVRQVVVEVSPPNLGELTLQFAETPAGIELRIQAETPQAREALRTHLPVLAAQLAQAEVPVRTIELSDASAPRHHAGQQHQHSPNSGEGNAHRHGSGEHGERQDDQSRQAQVAAATREAAAGPAPPGRTVKSFLRR